MDGAINSFEENLNDPGHHGLSNLLGSSLFEGIVVWPRGGGWLGPYPADEFWIDLNMGTLTRWALEPEKPEKEVFHDHLSTLRPLVKTDGHFWKFACALRKVALLSAKGNLRGHYSLHHTLNRLEWTRDWYVGGGDEELATDFGEILSKGLREPVIAEKNEASKIWEHIKELLENHIAPHLREQEPFMADFLTYSGHYGQYLYQAIEHSWTVALLGMGASEEGSYDVERMANAIEGFDKSWELYEGLREVNLSGFSVYAVGLEQ